MLLITCITTVSFSRKLVDSDSDRCINLAAVDIFGVAIRAKHATPHDVTADVHGARCGHTVARQTAQCIELVAMFAPVWALNLNSIMTSHYAWVFIYIHMIKDVHVATTQNDTDVNKTYEYNWLCDKRAFNCWNLQQGTLGRSSRGIHTAGSHWRPS